MQEAMPARETADLVIELDSPADALKRFRNMLAILCKASLQHKGWYGYIESGKRVLVVLK